MMTNAEFNPLYRDREIREKVRALCRRLYSSNKTTWNRGAPNLGPFFEAGDLEQESWIEIAKLPPGKPHAFYLKCCQNHLLDELKAAKRRVEIIPEVDVETGVVNLTGQTGASVRVRSLIWGEINTDFPGEAGAISRTREK